ncbi:hypothetical protein CCB80_08835 [Armatimonadetes bacterium Uphvl-Ar1]|nr:hypothetical protein CCB80_08835 [Armatimonadetes bacterium Uphvl-Ar1]
MRQPADSIRTILDGCGLGTGSNPASLDRLLAASELNKFEEGSYLWHSWTPARFFCVLVSGLVRLTQKAPCGKQVVVELLGPGDCTGLLATLGNVTHPFSCLALTDVEALIVDSDAWRDATFNDPELFRKATSAAITRMLGGYGFMAAMATGEVEARLALALLRLDDINARDHGPATPIHLTRKALAEIGVTTVESAIRITSRWNKAGMIQAGHKSLTILDRAGLYSTAQLADSSKVLSSDGVLTPLHQSG